MIADFRHARRALARSLGCLLAVVLTMAIGIGGTTTVGSVLRSVLLEPLSYTPAARTVALAERDSLGNVRPVSYPNFRDWRAAARSAAEAVAAKPGVDAVALTNHVPLTGAAIPTRIEAEGTPTGSEPPEALFREVDEHYFRTAGVPILQGRGFTADDLRRPGDAVLVNRALARRWWTDGSAVGRRVAVYKSAQGQPDFGEPVRAVGDPRAGPAGARSAAGRSGVSRRDS